MCCWKSEITSGAKRREVILTFNSSSRVNWQYKKTKWETEVSQRLINFVLRMYKQLTSEQRYVISALLKRNVKKKDIAREIGVHPSTLYRELKRNKNSKGGYSPKMAHEMAMERRERIVRNTSLEPGVLRDAIKLLKEKRWSPEQISGHLKLQGVFISKERIYQEIRRNPDLAQFCHHKMKYRRHKHKQYKTAGKSMIPDRVSIHDRPQEANGKRFGDWEMDLVIGAGQKSAVLTIIERSKNMFFQSKLPSKKPEDVEKAVIRVLTPFKDYVLTITTDNGVEFRNHKAIAKALGCTVYFADPYCSGQKGAVENANKIFREFFPKGTDFTHVTQRQLDLVQYQINDRPRKKLNFSKPKVEFYKNIM